MKSGTIRTAFMALEALLVVVILGILASIVLPQFTAAGDDAKESALVQNLQTLRSQIELYKFQHDGGYPAATHQTAQQFKDQMTQATHPSGAAGPLGDPRYPLGPYLIEDVLVNPYNGGRATRIVDDVAAQAVDESLTDTVDGRPIKVGWFFDPATGRLKANAAGIAADGTPLEEL